MQFIPALAAYNGMTITLIITSAKEVVYASVWLLVHLSD